MRQASLILAAVIVVIANALALVHVARNRAGNAGAEITLTNRELRHFVAARGDEDSGVILMLQWTDPNSVFWPAQGEAPPKWLDRQKLKTLGFDCSVNPTSSSAADFYRRQPPRRAFVALEYDGPAWQAWRETYERATAQSQSPPEPARFAPSQPFNSRLVAIDADLDRNTLRARHPNRRSVLIMLAAVAIDLEPFPYPNPKIVPYPPPQIVGHVQQMPTSISVPRPFSDEFRRPHPASGTGTDKDLIYRLRLRYGSGLEPWVTGVEFAGAK